MFLFEAFFVLELYDRMSPTAPVKLRSPATEADVIPAPVPAITPSSGAPSPAAPISAEPSRPRPVPVG
jgi:hypothetical protein